MWAVVTPTLPESCFRKGAMMKQTQAQQTNADSKLSYSKPVLTQEGSVDKVTLIIGGSYINDE